MCKDAIECNKDCDCRPCQCQSLCPVPARPIITSPAPRQTVYDAQPTITGTAGPLALVEVCIDGACTHTRANILGGWRVQAEEALGLGRHWITARQTNLCGSTSETRLVTFCAAKPKERLAILDLRQGERFRTVDVTFEIGAMSGDWTVYYLLLDPRLPPPTRDQVIHYQDQATLTNGQAARGNFALAQRQPGQLVRALPGREVDQPLPGETGVVDGLRYALYAVGASAYAASEPAASAATAIGMPFDGGSGTPAQPYTLRQLTGVELAQYPDLLAGHPANRAGTDESARQLDNIEGMRALYDRDPQTGIPDALALHYEMLSGFDLSGYDVAYDGAGWRPIGNYDATHYDPALAPHRFTGALNGGGYTVYRLTMTPTGAADSRWVQTVGLIGYAQGATVTDLKMSDALVRPTPVLPAPSGFVVRAAVVMGYSRGCVAQNLSVSEGRLVADFGANAAAYLEAGGVAGELVGGTVQSVQVWGLDLVNRSTTYAYFGGVAGYVHNDTPSQPYQDIRVEDVTCSAFAGTSLYAGGVLGYCSAVNPVAMDDAIVTGTALQVARAYAGGAIGYLRAAAATALSDIAVTDPTIQSTTSGYYAGGLVGYAQAADQLQVRGTTVSGADVRAAYGAGGMIGWLDVQAGAHVDMGDFAVTDSYVQVASAYAGGAVGEIHRAAPSTLYIHGGQVPSGNVVSGANNSGGLIGDLFHERAATFCYVQDCQAGASVTCTGSNAGGLMGFCNATAIADCRATGPVAGGVDRTGGLIGSVSGVSVKGCGAAGNVTGAANVGGLVGVAFGAEVLPATGGPFDAAANQIALCAVGATSVTATGSYVGGLVGQSSTVAYDQCYSLAHVYSVSGNYVGGLFGQANEAVRNCYAAGAVGGNTACGGLSGRNGALVTACYAAGAASGGNAVGGIVGTPGNTAGTVARSLALGALVSAEGSQAGRVIAADTAPVPLQGNYALSTLALVRNGVEVAPVDNPNGNDGGTVAPSDLPGRIQAMGWDTENVWDLSAIAVLGRPTLRANPEQTGV